MASGCDLNNLHALELVQELRLWCDFVGFANSELAFEAASTGEYVTVVSEIEGVKLSARNLGDELLRIHS